MNILTLLEVQTDYIIYVPGVQQNTINANFQCTVIFPVRLYSSEEVKCQQRKVYNLRDLYFHYRINSINKFTSVYNSIQLK